MPRAATTCAGSMLGSRPNNRLRSTSAAENWLATKVSTRLLQHLQFGDFPPGKDFGGHDPSSLGVQGSRARRSWSEHRRATSSSSQRIGQVRDTRYCGLHRRIQHVGWRVGGAGPWAAAMPIGDRLCHRCNSSTVRLGGSVASPAVAGGRIRERGVETPGTPDMMRPRLSPCTAAAMQSYCVGGRNVQS